VKCHVKFNFVVVEQVKWVVDRFSGERYNLGRL
jgi:hypothetical protein